MKKEPQDPKDFDAGWLTEGVNGEAFDVGKIWEIASDRIERYPDKAEMQRWLVKHLGVNVRQVEGVEGAFVLLMHDEETGRTLEFGEFVRADLLA